MDPITILLVALGFLLPSVTSLINSKADRTRDACKAEIIRAQCGGTHPGPKRRGGRRSV